MTRKKFVKLQMAVGLNCKEARLNADYVRDAHRSYQDGIELWAAVMAIHGDRRVLPLLPYLTGR